MATAASFIILFLFFIVATFLSPSMAVLGGTHRVPLPHHTPELHDVAKFAVDQHNSRQNSHFSLVRLISAQKQVVSGVMYYLTVEVETGGLKKLYEAKVWEKAWQNFKSLESFEPVAAES